MRSFLLFLTVLSLTLCAGDSLSATPSQHGVLVASAESTLSPFRLLDLRKLYLGVPLKQGNQWVQPIINGSNLQIREEFLQKILYMSSEYYDRQLITRVFQRGGVRPTEHTDRDKLLRALRANPGRITFMREGAVRPSEGIRVIQRLW